ncbi:hypothetical protein BD410DRAFT_786067 [Rickenella mellea]|uniref:Aminoglycoside phosphotransferase domain-containing protein n=1 Tax=Rickenella mellea TaxID=50990 RepID=A0A4Y7QAT1_9AGAM|nr:hypothetical protein BD410DRAFT_786067 [Rickenella mellea]
MTSIDKQLEAKIRDIVVEACQLARNTGSTKSSSWHGHCAISDNYFVKWGGSYLHCTAETQKYVYEQAVRDPKAPRVPMVYDCFDHGNRTFLVMKFIQSSTPQDTKSFHQLTANAIDWLRHCPIPPDARIGSLGGGPARHWLFKNWEAPLLFSSTEALELYMNRALDRMPRGRGEYCVHIRDEPLVITQSLMDESNFMLDLKGRLCLLDFSHVGLLPESFAVYTVKILKPFVREVTKYLSWSSPNLASMSRVGEILVMAGDSTLGLDENGEKKPRRHH